jgi:hypothetical protein
MRTVWSTSYSIWSQSSLLTHWVTCRPVLKSWNSCFFFLIVFYFAGALCVLTDVVIVRCCETFFWKLLHFHHWVQFQCISSLCAPMCCCTFVVLIDSSYLFCTAVICIWHNPVRPSSAGTVWSHVQSSWNNWFLCPYGSVYWLGCRIDDWEIGVHFPVEVIDFLFLSSCPMGSGSKASSHEDGHSFSFRCQS